MNQSELSIAAIRSLGIDMINKQILGIREWCWDLLLLYILYLQKN